MAINFLNTVAVDNSVLFVDAVNDRVGIGTTSPSYNLQVGDGTEDSIIAAYFSDGSLTRMHGYGLYMSRVASYIRPINTTTQTLYVGSPSNIWNAIYNNANTHYFATGANERMRIASSGNVGIGTTSPNTLLDVSSANFGETAPTVRITNTLNVGDWSGVTSDLGRFEFFTDDSSGNAPYTLGYIGIKNDRITGTPTLPSGAMVFATTTYNASGGAAEKMRITSDGNVGIGTDSPGEKLTVSGNGQFSNGSAGTLTVKHNYGYQQPNWGIKLDGDTNSSGGYLSQYINQGGFSLEQGGTYYANGARKTDANSTSYSSVSGDRGTVRFFAQTALTANTSFSASERMRIDTSGNVGIGTTSPTEKLDVAGIIQSNASGFQIDTGGYGDIRLRAYYGALNTSATLYVGGVNGYSYKGVYALSFNVNSDYRLKTNVVDLEEAIERVKQINVHRFNWKDRLDEQKVDGFLAHELAEVIPEAVTGEKDAVREDGTLDYQGVDQSKVVPLLTAALQEAISKIEQLETRIQTLENN